MSVLKIERVLALPATVTASTMYIVQATPAGRAELYFTSSDGLDTRHVIDETDVNSLVSSAIANFSAIEVVATIAARDALAPSVNTVALVIDATADVTVAIGAATYVYDAANTTWDKISEFATIDAVIDWANIANKPVSTVTAIDDAVTKRHAHANAVQLAKVGEDIDGNVTYNGFNPAAAIAVSDW